MPKTFHIVVHFGTKEGIGLVRVITTCEKIESAGIVDEDQNSVNKYSEGDGTKCLASEQSLTTCIFREVYPAKKS